MKPAAYALPLLAAASVALTGCAPSAQADADGNILVVAPRETDVQMLAVFSGQVAVGDGGCYGLANGDYFSVVVFPAGTTLSSDGEITTPAGDRYLEGDTVDGGGGWSSVENSPAEIPEACAASGEVFILN